MNKIPRYNNRELSWLSFNYRVLEQIKDTTLPLYERIKFLAIYSSNLDEFYRIRVASYRNLIDIPFKNRKNLAYSPEQVLFDIKEEVEKQQKEYDYIFKNQIIPDLEKAGIIIFQQNELESEHKNFIENYFLSEILPYLQPVLLTQGDVLTFLQDNVIYLAIKMYKKTKKASLEHQKKTSYAVIKIPTGHLPRFVELPKLNGKYLIFFLEDIIRLNLKVLFPGYVVDSSYSIKVSRDADLFIEDEFSGNLLEKLRKNLSKRKTGNPARFLFDSETPPDLLKILKLAFNLSTNDFVEGGRYLNFNDFFSFPNPMSPKFEITQWRQLKHQTFEKYDSILRAVHENDILLHFPYHTYDYVLRFLNEAALDPKVEEIKTTQYRLAKNSAIVNTLITAARNDKKVTVFVEIKARFDEEANISFSDQMKAAGINVIAGIPGLKVHAKAALIIRKSTRPSKKRGYAFVSTGNFNEKTAQLYSDHGLFTTKDEIIDDLKKMFEYLETPHDNYKFEHILVPRFNLIKELNKKISREEEIVKNGGKGYIIMKMNGLEEKDIIEKFYEASIKGVKIDLIVRGICCLKTNEAFSKNITVTRIVDRYLEHSRIFYFHNNGKSEIFISSADLMFRNMHRRVESTIPIYDEGIKKEIIDFLEMQLKDNTHARFIDKNNNNIEKISNLENIKYQAQIDTYLYLEKKLMLGV